MMAAHWRRNIMAPILVDLPPRSRLTATESTYRHSGGSRCRLLQPCIAAHRPRLLCGWLGNESCADERLRRCRPVW